MAECLFDVSQTEGEYKRVSDMEERIEKQRLALCERMKTYYEDRYRIYLTRRTPVILRLDGKCFHTVTRHCAKPFDERLASCIDKAAIAVCKEAQGTKIAYIQSDEINILLCDYDLFSTQAWFDNNIQKIVSIAASLASVEFSLEFCADGLFDCRAFNVPREEVCNYFISRQQDWQRNSLSMFAGSFFSPSQLHGKVKADQHEMLHSVGQNWADLPAIWKDGRVCKRESLWWGNTWVVKAAPQFKEDRGVIEDLLLPIEE